MDWAEDERCTVTLGALRDRVKYYVDTGRWTMEQAITHPLMDPTNRSKSEKSAKSAAEKRRMADLRKLALGFHG